MKKQTASQQLRVRTQVRAGKVCYRASLLENACILGCNQAKAQDKTSGDQIFACYLECAKQYPAEEYECSPSSLVDVVE